MTNTTAHTDPHTDATYHASLPTVSTFPLAQCSWLQVRCPDGYVTALFPPATAPIVDLVDALIEQGIDDETAEAYALRYVA